MSEEPNNVGNTPGETRNLSEDAQGLGPILADRCKIGVVDMIVGEGGTEVPGFVATKNEMVQLVRYWATQIIDLQFDFFLYRCTGSYEWRTNVFANRRLSTIGRFIGEEEVAKACREAEQEFGRRADQRAWKIFTEGTKEEQEEFQQEVQEALARDLSRRRTDASSSPLSTDLNQSS